MPNIVVMAFKRVGFWYGSVRGVGFGELSSLESISDPQLMSAGFKVLWGPCMGEEEEEEGRDGDLAPGSMVSACLGGEGRSIKVLRPFPVPLHLPFP